jgi:hypothetical protein
MTGPQTRVVTDLGQLSAKDKEAGGAGDDDVPFPELQHNLKLLVELAEADIHKLVRMCFCCACSSAQQCCTMFPELQHNVHRCEHRCTGGKNLA